LKPNIGEGSFGQVKIVNVDGRKIAIKRLLFSGVKKYEISLPSIIDQNDKCDPF
jgi:electron transfer flavoprotein alpha/beta subunit